MRGAVIAFVTLLVACGGQVSPSGDPGAPSMGTGGGSGSPNPDPSDGTFRFVSVIQNAGCLPQPLPTESSGATSCILVEALYGGGGPVQCAAHPGLTAADAAITTSIAARWSLSASTPVCVLRQLSGSNLVGGSCTQSGEAGFCYVTGGAAGMCAQTIAFSPAGNVPAGATVGIACP